MSDRIERDPSIPRSGKILVTGGAGFLARALYRRADAEGWATEFTCLSRDDAKHAALQARYPHVETVIGDVATMDQGQLTDLMRGFDVVIHAAASKFVDRSEREAVATFRTNVVGSERVALAAQAARVGIAVAISTDKACEPVNTYGASKLLMERIWADFAGRNQSLPGPGEPHTAFVLVRYGNVIGSTGSVIPLFERQLRETGKIQITDPEMTRFWMTADRAIDTILHAMDYGPPGTITIPEMHAMRLEDLALIALAKGGGDTHAERIEVVGTRPGEKQHERIISLPESIRSEADVQGFWFVHRPTFQIRNVTKPFEVTSEAPPLGFMKPEEMRAAIDDAATI